MFSGTQDMLRKMSRIHFQIQNSHNIMRCLWFTTNYLGKICSSIVFMHINTLLQPMRQYTTAPVHLIIFNFNLYMAKGNLIIFMRLYIENPATSADRQPVNGNQGNGVAEEAETRESASG